MALIRALAFCVLIACAPTGITRLQVVNALPEPAAIYLVHGEIAWAFADLLLPGQWTEVDVPACFIASDGTITPAVRRWNEVERYRLDPLPIRRGQRNVFEVVSLPDQRSRPSP